MDHLPGPRPPRPLRKAAALLLSAVVAGTFFGPAVTAVAAEAGTGNILGRLICESGAPVAGEVIAIDEDTGQVYSTTALPDGAYAITAVPAGRYAVMFRPSEEAAADAPFGYVEAWFPHARRGDDAARVVVDVGVDTVAVDSSLTAAARVRGAVAAGTGSFAVALLDEPTPVDPFDGDTLVAEVDPTGSFALRAPAGEYELVVYRRVGFDWQPYFAADGVVRAARGGDVALTPLGLPEPGAVELVLRHTDGEPATETDVTLIREGSARIERDGLTDEVGRVLFEALAPGTYTVAVDDDDVVAPDVVRVEAGRFVELSDQKG